MFSASRKIHVPRKVLYPLFVKSLTEEASAGITQNSIVYNDKELKERVEYFAENVGSDVIAESYIDGREFYVSIMGNHRLEVLSPWELLFHNLPERVPRIATHKVKWESRYRKKYGIDSGIAKNLEKGVLNKLQQVAKRTYKALGLGGYARIDLRMDKNGSIYVIEANPNPDIGLEDEFSDSAKVVDYRFSAFLNRILSLGLSWTPLGT